MTLLTTTLSDIELIDEALAGERRAYEILLRRYQEYAFTLALRFSRNREDAEEIAQDSFLKAFRNLGSFQRQSKFSTWFYSIVYTTAMTHLRKKKHDFVSLDQESPPPELGKIRHSEHAGKRVERKIERVYIEKAIESMLPDDAVILTMFYLSEQSLDEIASVMDMNANTVKVKLHRARQRFKIQLERLLKAEVKELI